jgi:hypothetical protein
MSTKRDGGGPRPRQEPRSLTQVLASIERQRGPKRAAHVAARAAAQKHISPRTKGRQR